MISSRFRQVFCCGWWDSGVSFSAAATQDLKFLCAAGLRQIRSIPGLHGHDEMEAKLMMNTSFFLASVFALCLIASFPSTSAEAPQYNNYSAGNCPVLSTRSDGNTNFYDIKNACDQEIIVVWAVERPARGDFRTGNAYLQPGETHETQVEVGEGIETYSCIYPHHPVDADGNSLTHVVNGYSCR